MILYIILIIFIIINIKGIYDINKININSEILTLQSQNEIDIQEAMNELNPILIYNLSSRNEKIRNLTLEKIIQMNPGYIIQDNSKNISLDYFLKKDYPQMSLYENRYIISDIGIQSSLDNIIKYFCNTFSCNKKHSLNIFKGNQITKIQKQKNKICLITQIQNNSTYYLFHPKYKNDILNKENNKIKKWGNKIIMEPGIVLSIPPNWYYFCESNTISIMCKSICDDYFSYLYNLVK